MKYELLIFDELDSTNSEALRLAYQNVDSNYVILAKTQTNGRGQKSRNWQSLPGNLQVSLLIKPDKNFALFPQLSFVTALAVRDSISSCDTKDVSIKLKWPNDILVNSKKISGILLESVKVKHTDYLVIGIGINIMHKPANINQVTSFAHEGFKLFTAQELLNILINNFSKYYQIWDNDGFDPIRKSWLINSYKLQKDINIKDRDNIITGKFIDIDNVGRILIQLPSKKIFAFSAAELSF